MRADLVACLLSVSAQLATQEALEPVLDFAGPDTAQKWQAVNDGVMGGISDGREYVLNLYAKSRRMAFSYRAPLPTTNDKWTEVRVPLEDFIPTAFGRRVQGMGPVEPNQINGLGFMLSDKKPGKFRMQVQWVKVERGEQ